MASPSIAVPRPGGRPMPSGPMLMSHAAMSAGAIGCPNCGAWARADDAIVSIVMQTATGLSVNIASPAHLVNTPACDGVVVVAPAQATLIGELRARWLHHAGIVSGATLQYGGTAIPLPSRAEAHKRFLQDRALQSRRRPALSTLSRPLDPPDAAASPPNEPRNLVESGSAQRESRRRTRDEGFHFDREHELPGLFILEYDRVFRCFVFGHGGAGSQLEPAQPLHVHVALETRQQQPHRIAVRRPHA